MAQAAEAPAISAVNLDAGYGHIGVLRNVNLEVWPGEIVALLGANGAGKSTLMLSLMGFLSPSSGHVELAGRPCRMAPNKRARRGLSFIGEDRDVFPTLTVSQNLRLVRQSVDSVTRFPELRRLRRRRAGLISGGEQQMLALERALATSPKVLLVDELSFGLAPLVCERLLSMLQQVADEQAALLVVEQNIRSILGIADRAYVLRRGEIVDHRPANVWLEDLDELATILLS
jgi:branched-chain amino acid transport system ATP-binding protein